MSAPKRAHEGRTCLPLWTAKMSLHRESQDEQADELLEQIGWTAPSLTSEANEDSRLEVGDAPLPGRDDVGAPLHRLDRPLRLCVLAKVGDGRRVGKLPDRSGERGQRDFHDGRRGLEG